MYKISIAATVAIAGCSLANCAAAAQTNGFLEDSKVSVSSRTMYYDADTREGAANDQRETAQGFRFDYSSGFTTGTLGFGVDVQAVTGIHLDGGPGHHPDNNSFFPSDHDGSALDSWSRLGANGKFRLSKTELVVGSALAPNIPVLLTNDGRLLPQSFEGGMLTSREIENVTLVAGQIEHVASRASSNSTGLAVSGGTQESNQFRFGGADWRVTKDLMLQYYHANLQNYYSQDFLGLVHLLPISEGQSFKTDIRYFDSRSDGKNGDAGYQFNNNGGYAKTPGKVDNDTWSAMFTYSLGGHSFMLGRQQVSGSGGFVYLNQGSLPNEGNGGTSFYSFTDSMVSGFVRAGEKTSFGQYSYDFAAVGVPGLRASVAYLSGDDIKDAAGRAHQSEWERDMRVDYVIQTGVFKGLGTSLRQGLYRGDTSLADQNQTRLIVNYTYNFM
ncbi:OprD family porin [Pseudomonas yamanorum]|uniref:OprD family outer membrane porin n=1 Tax=Pseudomonas yamanorum TaxID=515393 RepID=UPI001C43C2A0|nr:OprD family outer membrane porin [Pseudomonas yamanorum]MBV6659787.1 OprD family porin [Pseudomonas yamanorum]